MEWNDLNGNGCWSLRVGWHRFRVPLQLCGSYRPELRCSRVDNTDIVCSGPKKENTERNAYKLHQCEVLGEQWSEVK